MTCKRHVHLHVVLLCVCDTAPSVVLSTNLLFNDIINLFLCVVTQTHNNNNNNTTTTCTSGVTYDTNDGLALFAAPLPKLNISPFPESARWQTRSAQAPLPLSCASFRAWTRSRTNVNHARVLLLLLSVVRQLKPANLIGCCGCQSNLDEDAQEARTRTSERVRAHALVQNSPIFLIFMNFYTNYIYIYIYSD